MEEVIVAVYDTPAHAALATQDLLAAGCDERSVVMHADAPRDPLAAADASPRPPGFWARLFGAEPEHDTAPYDERLRHGSTVVTVRVGAEGAAEAIRILESHRPVDIGERVPGGDGTRIRRFGLARRSG